VLAMEKALNLRHFTFTIIWFRIYYQKPVERIFLFRPLQFFRKEQNGSADDDSKSGQGQSADQIVMMIVLLKMEKGVDGPGENGQQRGECEAGLKWV
jgi:hypothetical protein